MVAEKENDITVDNNLPDDSSGIQIGKQKRTNAAFQEAAEIYGVAIAQELGYVQRGYVYRQNRGIDSNNLLNT